MSENNVLPKVLNFINGEFCEVQKYKNSIDPSNLKELAQSNLFFRKFLGVKSKIY